MAPLPTRSARVFCPSGGRDLYALIWQPDPLPPAPAGLVLCPPFADEAVHARRPLAETGRRLAEAGTVALLLDYTGTGDSGGEFEEGSLDAYVRDIQAASEYLRAHTGLAACGLLGLRVGAHLALWAAAADARLAPLVLWAPLDDLAAYFRRFLRLRLFTEMSTLGRATSTVPALETRLRRGLSVDVLGYAVSPAMARSFTEARVEPPPGDRPTLILELSRGSRQTPSASRNDGRERTTGDLTCRRRVSVRPFWEGARTLPCDALIEPTLAWLAAAGAA